jgi:hypothetical protein
MRRDTRDIMWLVLWYGWVIILVSALAYFVFGFDLITEFLSIDRSVPTNVADAFCMGIDGIPRRCRDHVSATL